MKRKRKPGEFNTPLKIAREALNLSSGELARRAGIDISTFNRVERGLQTPSVETASAIARVMNLGSELTEMHILYPRRFRQRKHAERSVANGGNKVKTQTKSTISKARRDTFDLAPAK